MGQQSFEILLLFILVASSVYCTALARTANREKRADPLEAVVNQLSQTVNTLTARLQASEATITSLQSELSRQQEQIDTNLSNKGSTYILWGKSQCANGSELVYSGIGGGSDVLDSGSGGNQMCLSPDPVFDHTPILGYHASLTGLQHYLNGHTYTDVVCALCYTPLTTTFMVPGTNRCPGSSVLQYKGYLVASHMNDANQPDYLCLHTDPADPPGTGADQRPSGFLEHAVTTCGGSLACPPYQDNKVVTCAVCSM